MKRKMITVMVSLVAIVAVMATVGVSFALWESEPSAYTYVVNTESYANIDIEDIVVDSGKLKPKSDMAAATTVVSTFIIDIQEYKCSLLFTVSKVQYKDKQANNEWVDLPARILKIEFTNEDGATVSDKAPPFNIGKHTFKVKVTLEPHLDIIDPIYKNTEFRYNIHIAASAQV